MMQFFIGLISIILLSIRASTSLAQPEPAPVEILPPDEIGIIPLTQEEALDEESVPKQKNSKQEDSIGETMTKAAPKSKPYKKKPTKFFNANTLDELNNKNNRHLDKPLNSNYYLGIFHKAILSGSKEYLLATIPYINVNVTDPDGNTPLMYAILSNQPDSVMILLNNKANVNVQNKYGVTPLHLAAKMNNPKIFNLLMNYAPDINKQDKSGNTPLMDAIRNKNIDATLKILSLFPNINTTNTNKENVLNIATKSNYLPLVEKILNRQISQAFINNLDAYGETPLISAVNNNNIEMVNLLLSYGASPFIKNNYGVTAIELAKKQNFYHIMEFLETYQIKQQIKGKYTND